jgi:hypothetical protein
MHANIVAGGVRQAGAAWVPTSSSCSMLKLTATFVSLLGQEAEVAGRKVNQSSVGAAAFRKLSVRMCCGKYQMCRALSGLLACVSGQGFCAGAARLTDKVMCVVCVHY